MNAHGRTLAVVFGLLVLTCCPAWAADPAPTLSADDKTLLEGLLRDLLFDPKGAQRVRIDASFRTVWTGSQTFPVDGWLAQSAADQPARVYFADGASVTAPPEPNRKKVDYLAECRTRYPAAGKNPADPLDHDHDAVFRRMSLFGAGAPTDDALVDACWLHRLGDDATASRALAVARDETRDGDLMQGLRNRLAWGEYAATIHAYMVRADQEALDHGERLLKRYPAEAAGEFSQAAAVVADLKRRRQLGTFGKTPAEGLPAEYRTWDDAKKAEYLIAALDEVDARQHGQPGGIDLSADPRVTELVRLGDPAVPALIDALERDDRLTRSVHFWRDFSSSRTVMEVREAVLTALMSILRSELFDPVSTGDSFTARGEKGRKQRIEYLRTYWKKYGSLPFERRMMAILTDPTATFEARREAASNLGSLNDPSPYRTTFGPQIVGAAPPEKPNPALRLFENPTAAEAILSAMDADLAKHDASPVAERKNSVQTGAERKDSERREIEGTYLNALIGVEDKRIAPTLAARSKTAEPPRMRRRYAWTAQALGEPSPMKTLAEEFAAGTNPAAGAGINELYEVVGDLVRLQTPEADRALAALAIPSHPHYQVALKYTLGIQIDRFDDREWLSHPFCTALLRSALDDAEPTGARYLVKDNRIEREEPKGGWSRSLPDLPADKRVRRNETPERRCDLAALQLHELVFGSPFYHPLLIDADRSLTDLKTMLNRYGGKLRRFTYAESNALHISVWQRHFVPDFTPLGRPATAADVEQGGAVFHLDGRGKLADLALPAVGILKRDAGQERPPRVLIVQAERNAAGRLVFGIVARHEIRSATEDELAEVKTFADLERKEREAAPKAKPADL